MAISRNQWPSVAITWYAGEGFISRNNGHQWQSPGTWGGHRRLASLEAATIGYGHHLMREAISMQ
jgi:hypothetical protein